MSEIQEFKNKYDGKRVFMIGNGPSLNDTPLECLNDEYTIAMNKINQIYDETSWRPSIYYFANSPGHSFSNEIADNVSLGIPCFVNANHEKIIYNNDNVIGFNRFNLLLVDILNSANKEDIRNMPIDQLLEFWSDNIEHHVYHYHTMYGASQLAVYLGFDELYFVGCDLGQEYQNPHMIYQSGLDPERYNDDKYTYFVEAIKKDIWKSLTNGVAHQLIKKSEEMNIFRKYLNSDTDDHFVSDYLSDRRIHDGPRDDTQITKGHIATKRICEQKGIKTYNATIGGELEVYPRVNIENII